MAEAATNTVQCATDELKGVQALIRQAGTVSVCLSKNKKDTNNYDHELSKLNKKQKDLKIRKQNIRNADRKSILKTEINKTLRQRKAD